MKTSVAFVFASGFVPATAWALCPNCLGQTDALSPTLKLIGVLLLLPFVMAALTVRAIVRAVRRGDVAPPAAGVSRRARKLDSRGPGAAC